MDRKKIILPAWLALLLLAFLFSKNLLAHPLGPSLLKITEDSPQHALVEWKTPIKGVPGAQLIPVLPSHCIYLGEKEKSIAGKAFLQRWEIQCQAPLVGSTILVQGIGDSKADVILRLDLADGRNFNTVLRSNSPSYRVPAKERPAWVFRSYLLLGFEHILSGLDHLLFILGLVLLVPNRRQLLWTVTAFTLGHSLTLTLAVLGLVNIPVNTMEALIALSIVVLAAELTRDKKIPLSFFHRYPWAMAMAFGLLHGMGFAGALAEVGLPTGDIALGLFSFNIGIEIGQLLFIAFILLIRGLWRVFSLPIPLGVHRWTAYGIGCLSAFWFLERLDNIF